jgi:hypothetical protein
MSFVGPRGVPRRHKFKYDLFYLKKQSFWLDLKLIALLFRLRLGRGGRCGGRSKGYVSTVYLIDQLLLSRRQVISPWLFPPFPHFLCHLNIKISPLAMIVSVPSCEALRAMLC